MYRLRTPTRVEGIAMDITGGELVALFVLFAVPIGLAAWLLRR